MDNIETRKQKLSRFERYEKKNPNNQESEFFSDFLLPNCENLGTISDGSSFSGYVDYFEEKFGKIKAFSTAYRISFDFLADHPECFLGCAKADQMIYHYFQVAPEILMIGYYVPILPDQYEIDYSQRVLIGTLSYFDHRVFKEKFPEFREKYILKMPDLKQSLIGEQTGGFAGFRN